MPSHKRNFPLLLVALLAALAVGVSDECERESA